MVGRSRCPKTTTTRTGSDRDRLLLEAKLAEATAAGATLTEPVRDVGLGRLVATVSDPDGNIFGLLQDR
jgi:uncharacterized glyoxalase superfamily protein PhnB